MFDRLRQFWQRDPASAGADHREFEDAVASVFSYLVETYGFVRRPLRVISYERIVEFEKPAAKVIVQQELGSAPWVTLVAPQSIAPGSRREFGLHELEQELEKHRLFERTAAAPGNLRESLELLAKTLERTGTDVLAGDFSILFARLRRHVDAVGKSS